MAANNPFDNKDKKTKEEQKPKDNLTFSYGSTAASASTASVASNTNAIDCTAELLAESFKDSILVGTKKLQDLNSKLSELNQFVKTKALAQLKADAEKQKQHESNFKVISDRKEYVKKNILVPFRDARNKFPLPDNGYLITGFNVLSLAGQGNEIINQFMAACKDLKKTMNDLAQALKELTDNKDFSDLASSINFFREEVNRYLEFFETNLPSEEDMPTPPGGMGSTNAIAVSSKPNK